MDSFRQFAYQASKNHTRTVWVLKGDIKKFFANVDHQILKDALVQYIPDRDILWLLDRVIDSFETRPDVGLPLGNLTSQLLVNVYMNTFDQFVKHKLKAQYYIRYADDFVILSDDQARLESIIPQIRDFLSCELRLTLHPDKVFIKTFASGVDFLGWVHFPDHRVLRTTTKWRMFKKIKEAQRPETLQSYFGLLKHGNTFKIRQKIVNSQVDDGLI